MGALLIGPGPTVVVASIALLFQALFLAHGGLTTLGANIVSMGVVGAFAAYGVFHLLRALQVPLSGGGLAGRAFSDWATYATTSLELSTALHGDGSMCGHVRRCPGWPSCPRSFPLGIAEGFLTAVAYRFVRHRGPNCCVFTPSRNQWSENSREEWMEERCNSDVGRGLFLLRRWCLCRWCGCYTVAAGGRGWQYNCRSNFRRWQRNCRPNLKCTAMEGRRRNGDRKVGHRGRASAAGTVSEYRARRPAVVFVPHRRGDRRVHRRIRLPHAVSAEGEGEVLMHSTGELFSIRHPAGDRRLMRLDVRVKLIVSLAAILAVVLSTHVWLPLARPPVV